MSGEASWASWLIIGCVCEEAGSWAYSAYYWEDVLGAQTGTLAETEIVDYRLSFADQGKQTPVFHFLLQQTNFCFPFPVNERKFAVSVFRLQKTNGIRRFPLVPFPIH
jgi:hypothetical protein